MSTELKYRLKKKTKSIIRNITHSHLELYNYFFKHNKDLSPPDWKNLSGDGDFQKTGNEFFEYFTKFNLIRTDNKILDIGCGIGRMAVPLTNYLNESAVYEGFDIMKDSIKWCRKNISTRFPNFHFQVANIYNKEYNPGGKFKGYEYVFPYTNEYFDFSFLTSVFTHMMPDEIENYIKQISRVLKNGGKSLITFFLLNKDSLDLLEKESGSIDFKYNFGKYRVKDDKVPEAAIAYDEEYIRNMFSENGLKILEPIQYGSFCGRKDYLSFQDIVIVKKI